MLQVGFVPLIDAAPLIIAKEMGFFRQDDLKVQLVRELGWALIRDKILFGQLDAAHAVAGLPFAATLGLGCAPYHCVTSFIINLHGNAITVSAELAQHLTDTGGNLKSYVERMPNRRKPVFGTVSLFSSHHFLLREWLIRHQVDPDRDVDIVVVPPPQMPANLEEGNLSGFCVGEPWNSVAIRRHGGACASDSMELAYGHPEKVLMVRAEWAKQRRGEHLLLIRALKKACQFCQTKETWLEVAAVLSRKEYLDLPAAMILTSLQGDLGKRFRYSKDPSFHIFSSPTSNCPDEPKAHWVLGHFQRAGLISMSKSARDYLAKKVFRRNDYEKATTPPPDYQAHYDKIRSATVSLSL